MWTVDTIGLQKVIVVSLAHDLGLRREKGRVKVKPKEEKGRKCASLSIGRKQSQSTPPLSPHPPPFPHPSGRAPSANNRG